jgi:hypothetical protein
MLALSIRQPFAELILRGIKTAELRGKSTRIVGQRFYIYAAKAKAKLPIWSRDLQVDNPPQWMIELARQVKLIPPNTDLPTGVIVGSAVIAGCEEVGGGQWAVGREENQATAHCLLPTLFRWHLTDIHRLKHPRKPARQPQPVWFRPF